ncbi:uncharacterized protein TRAVEDRAFT_119887 [Trametes versicolor FP-101664 SS1]|uniref:uncharacterized protein n=1 Tax=Trametes versicolor (strain FP-101664) TaxID=717944 RepID=UPI00046244C4|nr:uncharacterized protein TRAVEDRAFT_119887 [Trametes versicolor FP-101664 SS1]EIW60406.1 hypothetical protein TRAVEDRAFT_119887 [Trametes versicolor FP-101664 SS1]
MADTSSTVNDDHPLALELSSLRAAVSRYQHEAHATSLKLQRHSLEASQAIEHARALERENARLKEEAAVLRANPDTSPTQATFQVPELTLALRRLSDKLTSVEEALLASTEELVHARSQLANGHNELEAARALAADARAREEEGLARERDLARKLKAAEEERRMSDLVVQEYADLVRKLDGRTRMPSDSSSTSSIDLQRPNNGSTATLVDSLAEGKSGLQRLLEEFNGDSERLETEITKLQGDNGQLYKELEVARLAAEHDRSELAKIRHELDKYHADDTTAAKMVSRYMKFSQTSTDTLQKAMDALRSRHSTTLHTLNAEIAHLQHALEHQRAETDRLRSALDDLTEDIAREAFGRRREVSLRLAFLGREENLAESLRRWIRRARESLDRAAGGSDSGELDADVLKEAFSRAMLDAEGLLEMLNSQPLTEGDKSPSGSVARLILAQDTVSSLTHELQEETVRRLRTERKLARLETPDHPEDVLAPGTKPLAHPVPHHASAGKAEISLLEQNSPPSALDVTPAGPSQAVVAEDILSPGVSIDEIVIVPSLDSSEPQASDHLSHPSPRTSVADDESHTVDALSDNTQSDIQAPVPTASHTFQSSDIDAAETPMAAAPSSPTPELVVAHSDTLPVSFPSDAEIVDATTDPGLPTLAPSFPHASVERISKPSAPSNVTPEASQGNSRAAVPMPLQLDATDGSALSPLPCSPVSPAVSAETSKESTLLANLSKVKHRYDNVQRGFRDCHLALKELKKSLAELSSPATAASADMHTLLRKAVERLDDYNEDARVELEIRIADDERVSSGYEALLSIPGALAHADGSENVNSSEMLREVAAFVNGTDRAVEKATQSFTQKLDDLEHDIASIKRTLHELALSSSEESSLSATSPSSRPSASPKWAGWAPSFLSPPRSTSPAPTFGSVMTSPRLRHSSSFTRPRESPVDSPTDPLANLGLRIAVPVPVRSLTYGGLSPGSGGPQRAGPRQRTTSGMFMLGLGMRSTSFGSGMGVHAGTSASASKTSLATPSGSPSLRRLATAVSPKDEESSEEEDGERKDGIDSDVE